MSNEKGQSVLIVDDSIVYLELTSHALEDKYNIFKAGSANEAMEILHTDNIDMILSDYNMPGKSGVELFAEVSEKFPTIGKVLVTAYSDAESVVDAINSGSVDKCIGKPWDNDRHFPVIHDLFVAQEKKMLEAQMVQNSKLASLGELAAGIVHEINNPLAFVDGNLVNLLKFSQKMMGLFDGYDLLNLPEDIRQDIEKRKEEINYDYLRKRMPDMIEKARDGVGRIRNIVDDMKTFSRQADSKFEEANIHDSLNSALNIMVYEYKNRIEIIKDYGNMPAVKCNIAKLSQVFINLLVNACHAIKEKGSIVIKTCLEGNMAVISISDSGEGIPESAKNKIFESFFTTKEAGKGTGLGLSISLRIIKEHHGELTLTSVMGEGTTFTIKIPKNGSN